jgi:hypothetical protein
MKATVRQNREAAEMLAIQGLTFLAAEPERLGRFLALSGIGPEDIRAAAQERGFLAGVLEHMLGDEELLVAFAESAGIDAAWVARACEALRETRTT